AWRLGGAQGEHERVVAAMLEREAPVRAPHGPHPLEGGQLRVDAPQAPGEERVPLQAQMLDDVGDVPVVEVDRGRAAAELARDLARGDAARAMRDVEPARRPEDGGAGSAQPLPAGGGGG